MQGGKCEQGYIQKQKVFQSFRLLLDIAIGVLLFLAGFFLTGTRANVFTVLAILMVLPAAKRVIVLVIMLPRKSVESARYERMKEMISERASLLADYVFASPDKVMSMDFVIVEPGIVMGILGNKKQNEKYITEYLQKGVNEKAPGYSVKLFASDDEFVPFYQKFMEEQTGREPDMTGADGRQSAVEYLKGLAV